MDPMRIFVTGASGFVGRHLIAHLLETYGADLTLFAGVHPTEKVGPFNPQAGTGWSGEPELRVTVVPLDIADATQTAAAIRAAAPRAVVHLAARSSGADTDRDAIMATNVEGTRNVLEAAARVSPFPHTLTVSTGYVYGSTDPQRPAREDDAPAPMWRLGAYADSKIEMESVARNYRAFATIVRPFAHTGPGQPAVFATPSFARQLARIERGLEPPLIRVGNLDARRDILDVRDVVRAYRSLIEHGQPGETYNVGTGSPVQIREVLEGLRNQCMVPTEVEVDPQRLRPADISCSSGDPLLLHAATGWAPVIPLETTLRDTLNFWRGAADL